MTQKANILIPPQKCGVSTYILALILHRSYKAALKKTGAKKIMHSSSRILDDVARLAGGAAGIASGIGKQVRSDLKTRAEDAAMRLDLVTREEYTVLETRFNKLQKDHESLLERLSALESKK